MAKKKGFQLSDEQIRQMIEEGIDPQEGFNVGDEDFSPYMKESRSAKLAEMQKKAEALKQLEGESWWKELGKKSAAEGKQEETDYLLKYLTKKNSLGADIRKRPERFTVSRSGLLEDAPTGGSKNIISAKEQRIQRFLADRYDEFLAFTGKERGSGKGAKGSKIMGRGQGLFPEIIDRNPDIIKQFIKSKLDSMDNPSDVDIQYAEQLFDDIDQTTSRGRIHKSVPKSGSISNQLARNKGIDPNWDRLATEGIAGRGYPPSDTRPFEEKQADEFMDLFRERNSQFRDAHATGEIMPTRHFDQSGMTGPQARSKDERLMKRFLTDRWDELLSFIGSKRGGSHSPLSGKSPEKTLRENPEVIRQFIKKKLNESGDPELYQKKYANYMGGVIDEAISKGRMDKIVPSSGQITRNTQRLVKGKAAKDFWRYLTKKGLMEAAVPIAAKGAAGLATGGASLGVEAAMEGFDAEPIDESQGMPMGQMQGQVMTPDVPQNYMPGGDPVESYMMELQYKKAKEAEAYQQMINQQQMTGLRGR